jgi:adenylate cyclase
VVGDAMVAIWVTGSSDLALRRKACEATLEVAAKVERFNRAQAAGTALPTRLALHAGDMLVGNIGASRHFEYRAVGDTVNTASRLQGLNKVLGTTLLASTTAIEGVHGLLIRPLGSFRFVGKSSALEVVELLGYVADADPARVRLCEGFAAALGSYAQGRWQEAAGRFSALLVDTIGDGPARFYLAHCTRLLAQPPTLPWSPTITLDNK